MPEMIKITIKRVKRIRGVFLKLIIPLEIRGAAKRDAIPKPKMMTDFGKLNGSKEDVYIKNVTQAAPTSTKNCRKLAAR